MSGNRSKNNCHKCYSYTTIVCGCLLCKSSYESVGQLSRMRSYESAGRLSRMSSYESVGQLSRMSSYESAC